MYYCPIRGDAEMATIEDINFAALDTTGTGSVHSVSATVPVNPNGLFVAQIALTKVLLSKSVRDAQGRLHKRDESLTIVSRLPRADFDTRPLLKVRFEDGAMGVVFSEEVQVSPAEWVSRNKIDGEAAWP
jgi:hypothetical protein